MSHWTPIALGEPAFFTLLGGRVDCTGKVARVVVFAANHNISAVSGGALCDGEPDTTRAARDNDRASSESGRHESAGGERRAGGERSRSSAATSWHV